MVRKVMTYIECDRCEFYVVVESPKGFIFGYKIAPLPSDWDKTKQGDELCPKCKKEWELEYIKFIESAKKRKK